MRATLSKARGAVAAAAAAALLAVAGCSSAPGPGASAPPAAPSAPAAPAAPGPAGHTVSPNAPVTVALLLPTTAETEGPARLARAMNNAAQLAVADLRDPQMRVNVYNTAGDPARAGAVAREALAQGADIFLGPLFAATTEEVGRVAGEAGRKVISFSTNTVVAGGPVAVIGYTPELEAERVLSYAAQQGLRDVAVFHARNDYGEAALRGARRVADRGEISLVAVSGYERSFKGIEAAAGPFAQEAAALGASAVLLPAGGQELQAVGSFMNFNGLDPDRVQYLGLGQWSSRATFGEAALEGGWFPAPDPEAFARFAARYRTQFGEEPPLLATLGYTAVQIAGQMLAAARASGSEDAFAEAVLTRPQGFQGALGPLRIAPDGTSAHALAIREVGPDGFIERAPAPRRGGPGS